MTSRQLLSNTFFSFLGIFLTFLAVQLINLSQSIRHEKLNIKSEEMDIADLFMYISYPDASDSFPRFTEQAALDTKYRITVIEPDGVVIFDSHYDVDNMVNHINRPEIQIALTGETGFTRRTSGTLGMAFFYCAVPVFNEGSVEKVVRIAVSDFDYQQFLLNQCFQLVINNLALLLVSGVVVFKRVNSFTSSLRAVTSMANTLASGDFEITNVNHGPAEVQDLSKSIRSVSDAMKKRLNQVKRQRNEIEAVLSSMIESVIVLDTELKIVNLNPAACLLAGKQYQDTVGKSLMEIFRNTDLYQFAAETLKSGTANQGELFLYDHSQTLQLESLETGSPGYSENLKYLQVYGTVLKPRLTDNPDSIDRIVLVLNDITKLKELENVRRDFVANVSHELRTPVTSIQGFVETLIDGALDDQEHAMSFLHIISRQAERLDAIIEDLLSLSRLEQRKEMELEHTRLQGIILDAVQVCTEGAEKKNMHIEVYCSPTLTVLLNPILIENAIINLIDNAVKYNPDGTDITVLAEIIENKLHLSVADNGQGIPQTDQPRIFERFYRVDKARSREMGGTGLGLSIVKHIALSHRGNVSLESTEGIGSTFTLILPQ